MNGSYTQPGSKSWYFGDDWPGIRCGAKTRQGTPCKKAALTGKTRCQLHGGRAGAPSGERNGNYRTGQFTKAAKERRRKAHQESLKARATLKELYTIGKKLGMFE